MAQWSYRFSDPGVDGTTATLARERALSYAMLGSNQSEDIYFTRDEISHLVDVSSLYKPFSFTLNFFAVFAWGILIFAVYRKEKMERVLRFSAKALACCVALLCVCLVIFPFFFEVFHQILFPQGNWAFPADSLLIRIFPEIFWKFLLGLLTLMLLAWSGLFWLFGGHYEEWLKE